MKKKKKHLISCKEKKLLDKVNIIKSICDENNNSNYLMKHNKLNSRFNYLSGHMEKKNLTQDNLILPSVIKIVDSNLQIKPFWNDKIKKISEKLFLPEYHKIKKLEEITNKTLNSKTWFESKEYKPIEDIDSSVFSLKNISPEEGKVKKVKKIKLYLNKKQKIYMRQIVGTYRYFYNRGVSYINNYNKDTLTSKFYINPKDRTGKVKIDCSSKNYCSAYTMRNILKDNKPDWLLSNFPTHLIAQALIECSNRFTTCLKQCSKTGKPFKFNYKQKYDKIHTVNMEKNMLKITNKKLLFDLFKCWKIEDEYLFRNIKCSEKIPDNYSDFSLSWNVRLNTFYLNIPYECVKKNNKKSNICSIDQGDITPFVIYSPDRIVEIGKNCRDLLYKVAKETDIIQSKISKNTSNTKRSLRKSLYRKIDKIQNLKNELHNKTIKYLTDNYKGIILPPFETKKMVSTLNSKVSRSLNNLSFYKFRTKLISKANEMNVKIYEFTEPFTSKTCGNCGKINSNLGNSRVFKCSGCKLTVDRDMNGSRNIFLRNISFIQ